MLDLFIPRMEIVRLLVWVTGGVYDPPQPRPYLRHTRHNYFRPYEHIFWREVPASGMVPYGMLRTLAGIAVKRAYMCPDSPWLDSPEDLEIVIHSVQVVHDDGYPPARACTIRGLGA